MNSTSVPRLDLIAGSVSRIKHSIDLHCIRDEVIVAGHRLTSAMAG
jgi:hypothetical protein